MKRALAVVTIGLLTACGGGNGNPPTTLPPSPTPTPVTYNGTYTGTGMTFTGGGFQGIVTASVTVTQTGSNLALGSLMVTSPFTGTYPIGPATLNDNTFDATNPYTSAGCGIVQNHYVGYFSADGGIMNLTITLVPEISNANCFEIDIRGELRR